MTVTRCRPSVLAARLLLTLFPAYALAGGCATTPQSTLTVTSVQSAQEFKPQFDAAYASRSAEGDYDVVLTGGSAPTGASAGEGARQVMHVRVLYRPMRGTRLDHPSATNASIRWYVLGDRPGDVVEYTGAGFVTVSPAAVGDGVEVRVRNASLRPVATRGNLTDPLGPTTVQGTFQARTDPQRVTDLLAEVAPANGAGGAARSASAR
jgi:hypothetical protein